VTLAVKPGQDARTGNAACWALAFYGVDRRTMRSEPGLVIGSSDYDGSLRASLPPGLAAGSYSFVIDGLTDDDYAKIAQKLLPVVRLYLYWGDADPDWLPAIGGDTGGLEAHGATAERLVADLAVTSVSRRAGARHYETTVTAVERAYQLLERPLCQLPSLSDADATDVGKVAESVAQAFLSPEAVVLHADPSFRASDDQRKTIELKRSGTETLRELGLHMEQKCKKRGRGMYLIRRGALDIGVRPIDPDGVSVDAETGLVDVEALSAVSRDPQFDRCANPDKDAPERRQFKVTLRGRPDLFPGLVLKIPCPRNESKTLPNTNVLAERLAGDGEAKTVTVYVDAVEHRLARGEAFVTELTTIDVDGDPWDTYTEDHVEAIHDARQGSAETRVASAADRRIRRSLAALAPTDVAEVRELHTTAVATGAAHTVRVWKGLEPADGSPHQSSRLQIKRPSPAPIDGVPYLSPFAWGQCGLVLPRYPGTRVLLDHRQGQRHDAIDVGALWEAGHGPQNAQPGDWWLILPVGVASNARASIPDTQTPQDHTGAVTHDLIDADGNRVIEVGELTMRVGRSLHNVGARPQRTTVADSVTIINNGKNGKTCSITLKDDGTVSIDADNIEFTAQQNITLSAQKVTVQ
jgi:hypothetical protein